MELYGQEYRVKLSYIDVLNEYYLDYLDYSATHNPNIEIMTFDEFTEFFYNQDTLTISEYINYLKQVIDEEYETKK